MTPRRAGRREPARFGAALAAATLGAACAQAVSAPPEPTAVEPSTAPSGAPTPVTLLGRFFLGVNVSYTAGRTSSVRAGFQARLGDRELTDVAWVDFATLSATVPADLAPGTYPLTVVDPDGRPGTLVDAFTVTAPAPVCADAEGPGGTASCTDGADEDCDGLTDADDPDCAPPSPCGWWDPAFTRRRRIVIENHAAAAIPAGYTVMIKFDHKKLVGEHRALLSGDDVRAVRCHGGVYTELDRVDDAEFALPPQPAAWNSNEVFIAFATAADLPPGGKDSDDFLYYGNPAAGAPPSDPARVYLWWDDFSTDTRSLYTFAKWVDVHGDSGQYATPTWDGANKRLVFVTGDNTQSDLYPKIPAVADALIEVVFSADLSYQVDATVALVARATLADPKSQASHYYADFSHGTYRSPGISTDSWTLGERNHIVFDAPAPFYWAFAEEHTLRYAVFGTSHKLWWNAALKDPPRIAASHAGNIAAGRWGFAPAQARGAVHALKMRRYLEPEPVLKLAGEEHL